MRGDSVTPEAVIAMTAVLITIGAAQWAIVKIGDVCGWNKRRTKRLSDQIGFIVAIASLLALYWIAPYILYPFEYLRDLMWADS